jgi:hypothetical protein
MQWLQLFDLYLLRKHKFSMKEDAQWCGMKWRTHVNSKCNLMLKCNINMIIFFSISDDLWGFLLYVHITILLLAIEHISHKANCWEYFGYLQTHFFVEIKWLLVWTSRFMEANFEVFKTKPPNVNALIVVKLVLLSRTWVLHPDPSIPSWPDQLQLVQVMKQTPTNSSRAQRRWSYTQHKFSAANKE